MTLAQRLLELHASLSQADIEHAFGGAIALAYWTAEPRGTRDIDINFFVPATDAQRALDALPAEVIRDANDVATVAHDGQIRLWWDDTPLDLFFSYEPIHEQARRHRRLVPFEGQQIPVLGPVELAVFKAMFDRTRDWADIEEMLAAGNLDFDSVREDLAALVEKDDRRLSRLDEARKRAAV